MLPRYLELPMAVHQWDSAENREAIHATFDAICRAHAKPGMRNQAHRLYQHLKRLTDDATKRRQAQLNEAEHEAEQTQIAAAWRARSLPLLDEAAS